MNLVDRAYAVPHHEANSEWVSQRGRQLTAGGLLCGILEPKNYWEAISRFSSEPGKELDATSHGGLPVFCNHAKRTGQRWP